MASVDSPEMSMNDIASEETLARIEQAISNAEMNTSGEIRVHLEDTCIEDPLDRASFIFAELEMHKTDLRNGVLIYLALKDRKLAIIGDVGINSKMESNSWDVIRQNMTTHFRDGKIEAGIVYAIEHVGEKIKQFFPVASDDRNELSNKVSTGNRENQK